MSEITKEAVQEKLNKGEALTKEETQFVMQSTDGPESDAQNMSDEDLGLEKENDIGKGEDNTSKDDKDKKAADEKAAKEKAEADEAAKKKSEEEAEAKKKADEAEAAKAKKTADEESFHAKVERTLALEDKDINLEGYSDKEKGLFWELRKERKARQQAEADRDAERFERIKKEKLAEAEAKKKADEKPEEGDDEFLTKGEIKKREKAEREARDAELSARARAVVIQTSNITAHGIVENRRAKGEDLPDYEKVMELGAVIIEGNEDYAKKIKEVWTKGGNAALACYDIIRKDPRFKSLYNPEAPVVKKEEKAPDKPADEKTKEAGKENLKKIEENEKKPPTSGAHGGGGEGDYGDYTADQLIKMSMSEFKKVPRKIREKFLKDNG